MKLELKIAGKLICTCYKQGGGGRARVSGIKKIS